MITYCKGQPGELPEIRDFINMVFSMNVKPHDFQALLPKLYETGKETEAFHYLAKEDGEIRAVVCVLPITLEHQNHTITCGTVGSVSAHPYSRGKGYMKKLMAMALDDMKKNRLTMSVLAGNRHRYQYYGYEPGGQLLKYRLTSDALRHGSVHYPSYPVILTPAAPDKNRLLWEKHQAQLVHACRQAEDFLTISKSWNCTVYTISHGEEIIGYICASAGHILELVLDDEQYLYSAISAYMELADSRNTELSVAPYQTERISMMFHMYERWSVLQDDNYRIFNYKDALLFFLNVKASTEQLSPGSLVIKPGGLTNLLINVSGQNITVEETDAPEDLALNHHEMVDLLFSSNIYYMGSQYPALSTVNWFPLPLSISHIDKC